jgi:hypothetical protein
VEWQHKNQKRHHYADTIIGVPYFILSMKNAENLVAIELIEVPIIEGSF